MKNITQEKSFAVAIRVVTLYRHLCETKKRVCLVEATVAERDKGSAKGEEKVQNPLAHNLQICFTNIITGVVHFWKEVCYGIQT